jgi:hypothetical protein
MQPICSHIEQHTVYSHSHQAAGNLILDGSTHIAELLGLRPLVRVVVRTEQTLPPKGVQWRLGLHGSYAFIVPSLEAHLSSYRLPDKARRACKARSDSVSGTDLL